MGAYDRIVWRGRRFDRMTVAAIEHAEGFLGGPVPIMQGSYSTSVGLSAGTHAGGGALDVDNGPYSWDKVERSFRLAGFAFWNRNPSQGPWPYHGHGILIGNAVAASMAKAQVSDYYRHRNGLRGHAYDPSWRPAGNPVPFLYPLARVDLSNMQREATKRKGYTPLPGVRTIQRTLNLKIGAGLSIDGVFGLQTRRAYARWERLAGGDGDGIPQQYALRLLGAARFNIVQ